MALECSMGHVEQQGLQKLATLFQKRLQQQERLQYADGQS